MKKWKMSLAWTAIALVIVIASTSLLDAYNTWIAGTRRKQIIAALREAGEPVCRPISPTDSGG